MTRLRNVVLGSLAALAIGGVASSASANEVGTFQNRLTGATIGLPLGALPPPGLYSGLETAYLGYAGTGGQTAGNWKVAIPGANLPAIAQAVPLLWVPGWNFLGASYGASIVQAFYTFETCGAGACGLGSNAGSAPITGGGYVIANTTFNPITLSWNLGGGWFVSGAFNFMAPDGTKSAGTPNPDYWTFEPALAISYLANNWVLSANMFYDINTASAATCCTGALVGKVTNGQLFYADLTAVYKIGKWQIGPVGNVEYQTTKDTNCGVAALCGIYQGAAIGGLVGYDFGPVDVQLWATDAFVGQNVPEGPGGINIFTRLGFRIWGPEAPKPLVAKN